MTRRPNLRGRGRQCFGNEHHVPDSAQQWAREKCEGVPVFWMAPIFCDGAVKSVVFGPESTAFRSQPRQANRLMSFNSNRIISLAACLQDHDVVSALLKNCRNSLQLALGSMGPAVAGRPQQKGAIKYGCYKGTFAPARSAGMRISPAARVCSAC
ncbi:hypothetical protein EVAR_52068_1 [Eumeta japonica]|uniref:Uncharacterized protein n=1 Tax=Eumeta variegata TaxID=151549 RepID=A0A4C1XZX2_EUMVA|nr:hypothetical protein EVAR_52068_1 [Eumeta japonica]